MTRHDHAFTGRGSVAHLNAWNLPRNKSEADRCERWMHVCINAGEHEAARDLMEATRQYREEGDAS